MIIQNSNQNSPKKKVSLSQKIIVLEGKFLRLNNTPYIPIRSLNSKYKLIKTNSSGEFKTCLKKGIYTFFIVDKNNAYSNRFDGKGFFKSININSSDLNINLIKDNNSTF